MYVLSIYRFIKLNFLFLAPAMSPFMPTPPPMQPPMTSAVNICELK